MAYAQSLGQVTDGRKVWEIMYGGGELPYGPAASEDQEVFWVLTLDTQLYLRGVTEIARGERDRVATPIPDTVRLVLGIAALEGASAFIVVHNHPSGDPSPSSHDRAVTRMLKTAALAIEIDLLDHVILGTPGKDPCLLGHFSFRAAGQL